MSGHEPSSFEVEIHLLGQFRVLIGGEALPEITGRKGRALLKLLALQRQGRLVRDQAMDALWPDLDASAAASQLYKAIHHVRKAFSARKDDAGEWIEISEDLIRLDPPDGIKTDVRQFEEAARAGLRDAAVSDLEVAVSLYTGDLLPMDTYARWTSLPREHYRQLYLDTLIKLAEIYESRGELSEAAEMLRLALEKDPVLESAHRSLIRMFARQGQTTRARRQYQLCEEVLERELGVSPAPETSELLAFASDATVKQRSEPAMLHVTTPAPSPPIVGRDRERVELDDAVGDVSAGSGRVLMVTGGIGVGKTRLVQELALTARRAGLRVLSGAAAETGRGVSYGPFIEILDSVLHENQELQKLLPEEIGHLVPSFTGSSQRVPSSDKLAAQAYLFAQVQRFFARLSEIGPLVLVVEDLHMADEGSRALFYYLCRYVTAHPILLAGTLREGEGADDLLRDIRSLPSEEAQTILDLEPLSVDDHRRLLQQRASETSDEAAERIYRVSEGNPLFALELFRFHDEGRSTQAGPEALPAAAARPVESIPSSLRRIVDRRMENLSPAARHLLCMCSVVGRRIPYELISTAWSGAREDGDELALFGLLEEATRSRLLEERGLHYHFRHALLPEAIYDSMAEPRRRALHDLVARQLVSISRKSDDRPVEQIAFHFARAGDVRKGVEYLILAAERAEAAYAHDNALRRLEDALALLEKEDGEDIRRLKMEIYGRMGDVYRACGRLEQSYDAFYRAVELSEGVQLATSEQAQLHRKIALVAIFRTEMDRSERHLNRAFELVDDDTRERARLLIIRALQLWHFNRLEEASETALEALDLAESVGAAAEASQACEMLAMAYLPLGRWEEGLEYEMRRQVYGWSPDIVVATDAHLCLWEYHVSGDQPFDQARTFITKVSEQAAHLGDLRCVAVCHYALGTMHLWRGQDGEAVEELDASLELHDSVGSPAGMAYVLARKGVLHTMRGTTELGLQAVEEGIEHARRAAVRDHCLQRLYGVGIWNRLEAGDMDGAGRLVAQSEELLDETAPCSACALELYPWLAYYHLERGEVEQAGACGSAVAELASKTGNPIGRIVAAMIGSSISAAEKDLDRAEHLRREAFDLASGAIEEDVHSPVMHYLERMSHQQAAL